MTNKLTWSGHLRVGYGIDYSLTIGGCVLTDTKWLETSSLATNKFNSQCTSVSTAACWIDTNSFSQNWVRETVLYRLNLIYYVVDMLYEHTCIFIPISIEHFGIAIGINDWCEFTIVRTRSLIGYCELFRPQHPIWTALVSGQTLGVHSFHFSKKFGRNSVNFFFEVRFPPWCLIVRGSNPPTGLFINSIDIVRSQKSIWTVETSGKCPWIPFPFWRGTKWWVINFATKFNTNMSITTRWIVACTNRIVTWGSTFLWFFTNRLKI